MAEPLGTRMVDDGRTARQIFEEVLANPARARFGFGARLAVVNVDLQRAYTDIMAFRTAYETDPDQIAHINRLSAAARRAGMPVVWTRVGYREDGADAGIWGTRTNTPDSLQNIAIGSARHAFDPRCERQPEDLEFNKRMPSAFFETPLRSWLQWHGVDTVVVTGGSTSGCVRATAVDSLSHGFRTIVPLETCADKHASFHYASLTDLALKYADVVPVAEILSWLEARRQGITPAGTFGTP
ncbi:isochorismatase family protein [Thermaurantiacus sp.]